MRFKTCALACTENAEIHVSGAHQYFVSVEHVGATLYIDEATDAQVPRVAMLTNLDGDDKPMMLGLSRVASHYSYEQRDVLMEKMDYIKHVATAMGYSQRW